MSNRQSFHPSSSKPRSVLRAVVGGELRFEDCEPFPKRHGIGEPLDLWSAVRPVHDQHELDRVVVVARFKAQGLAVALEKGPTPKRDRRHGHEGRERASQGGA